MANPKGQDGGCQLVDPFLNPQIAGGQRAAAVRSLGSSDPGLGRRHGPTPAAAEPVPEDIALGHARRAPPRAVQTPPRHSCQQAEPSRDGAIGPVKPHGSVRPFTTPGGSNPPRSDGYRSPEPSHAADPTPPEPTTPPVAPGPRCRPIVDPPGQEQPETPPPAQGRTTPSRRQEPLPTAHRFCPTASRNCCCTAHRCTLPVGDTGRAATTAM
jgi:hypothetical protein